MGQRERDSGLEGHSRWIFRGSPEPHLGEMQIRDALVNSTTGTLRSNLVCAAHMPPHPSLTHTQHHVVQAAHHQVVEDVAPQALNHAAVVSQVPAHEQRHLRKGVPTQGEGTLPACSQPVPQDPCSNISIQAAYTRPPQKKWLSALSQRACQSCRPGGAAGT